MTNLKIAAGRASFLSNILSNTVPGYWDDSVFVAEVETDAAATVVDDVAAAVANVVTVESGDGADGDVPDPVGGGVEEVRKVRLRTVIRLSLLRDRTRW